MPKISLNQWYAGEHWSKRKQIKDKYYWLIKSQFKDVLSKDFKYVVDYTFLFKSNPLDASNCVAMVKMIEDTIFENDKWDIVSKISISSLKGNKDQVLLRIDIF